MCWVVFCWPCIICTLNPIGLLMFFFPRLRSSWFLLQYIPMVPRVVSTLGHREKLPAVNKSTDDTDQAPSAIVISRIHHSQSLLPGDLEAVWQFDTVVLLGAFVFLIDSNQEFQRITYDPTNRSLYMSMRGTFSPVPDFTNALIDAESQPKRPGGRDG